MFGLHRETLHPPLWLVIALVLSAALLAAGLVTAGPAGAHSSSFPDVSSTSVEHVAVEFLTAAGVLDGFGDGTFRPRTGVTRAQAAKVLAEQKGIAIPTSGFTFGDVDVQYRGYVQAAANQDWVSGYPDGTFRPYSSLQRQHMAVLIVRSSGWGAAAEALSQSKVREVLGRFKDAGQVSGQAEKYVALAVIKGLLKGDTRGYLMPTKETSRAHFCMVAYRAQLERLAVVEDVRYSAEHLDKTRIVLDLSRKPGKASPRLEGQTLIVDVDQAAVAEGERTLDLVSSEAASISLRQTGFSAPRIQLRISLKSYTDYEVFAIAPSDGLGDRLVIDIYRKVDYGSGKPVVVVDPGHGGTDSGATGVTGLLEKHANLAIGLEVEKYLLRAGVQPLMTRRDDSYPSLKQRVDQANGAGADIFVSIHNNAADSTSKGTETYYWGDQDSYSAEGRRLAEAIQQAVCDELSTVDRGARTHWKDLYVLSYTKMPAALVEVGFLTNAEEEARLKDPIYRQRAGKAIAQGIVDYFDLGYVIQ